MDCRSPSLYVLDFTIGRNMTLTPEIKEPILFTEKELPFESSVFKFDNGDYASLAYAFTKELKAFLILKGYVLEKKSFPRHSFKQEIAEYFTKPIFLTTYLVEATIEKDN